MKNRQSRFVGFLFFAVLLLSAPAWAVDDVIITEFMAENDGTVEDEDGDTPDWIEIYNAGTNGVNLNGWFLTDSAGNLTKWRFPGTNLPVNTFMLIYASNKDRRIAGRPLHTNFRLDNDTGYLALVKPDGTNVQSAFGAYPQQVDGVSYGLPVTVTVTTLLSNGSPARFTVPVSDALGATWQMPAFDDSSWVAVTNGVGFESGGPASPGGTVLADSVTEFSGNQGSNNWFFGYWDKKADSNGSYEPGDFTPFPRGTGNTLAATNYWDGTKWDWAPPANPPWLELTSAGGHPSGDNGNTAQAVHWAVRRYVSETNVPLRISGVLACSGSSGTCGDGTIGRVIVDGTEVWQQTAFNLSLGYSIIVNVSNGSTIDFVIDSGAVANDFCDTTTFTAAIRTAGDAATVADSVNDWSVSGTQGSGNWFYGYYNRTADNNSTYESSNFVAFPSGTGPHSSANFWNGAEWDWFDGDPPFDRISRWESMPSIFAFGGADGNDHRVIRRWVSEVTGTLLIDWHLSKKDLTGGGVVGQVFRNNSQLDTVTIGAADFLGTTRALTVANVQTGDFIDFIVEPGADVIGDTCFFNAVIHGVTTLSNRFVTDVGAITTNINASAYLRIPFTVADPSTVNSLLLRVRYDDGFAAHLNGFPVASAGAPDPALWNSAATGSRADALAASFEDFNLTGSRDLLLPGENILAIQILNASVSDRDLLLSAELQAGFAAANPGQTRYFGTATPGSVNSLGTAILGPLITSIKHTPHEPADAQDLYVTAKVSPSFNPLGTVRLYYRVMFGAEANVVMSDDGLHGDGLPGDSVFGAVVPNGAYTNGQLVRYYITATDSANTMTRQPPFADTNNSPQYFGTVVLNPALTNPLPVLHWFMQVNNIDGSATALAKCQMYYLGEYYDNLTISRHGQSSGGFKMKSYDVDFNPGHNFRWAEGQPRVDDINFLQGYSDKSFMRNTLGYEMHGNSGVRSPTHFVVPVRVQSNAVFHGIMNLVENGDAEFIKRIGRDPNGSFYKVYDTLSSVASAEKKTRRYEDKSDLQALITAMGGGNTATRRAYLYDNVDISEVIDYLAAMSLTHNQDCCHKNYYVYRDTEGDGEWEMMPWDVDLSFGRNWQSAETYWDDRTYSNNAVRIGGNATLPGALFGTPHIDAMFLRRYRTLMDTLLQSNGVPLAERRIERRMDELLATHAPDAALHLAKWGTWGGGAQNIFDVNSPYYKTITQAANEIKNLYLPGRRSLLFAKSASVNGATGIPDAQPTNVVITIGAIEFNPASSNQAQEYIQLINNNAIYVDISGWKLTGAVTHTFQGGVVIPPVGQSNTLYVVPDKRAFRSRTTGPRGGQQLYVEGPYDGQLSARGETVYLVDTTGRLVTSNAYVGAPSGPQAWLRVSEIMYHPPAPPTGSPYEAEDFEYIELLNTGPTNIQLAGVHFTNGLEFTFPATTLAAGESTLLVRNVAAFTSRYGSGLNIAGAYVGILDNGGENLRLDDAVGEKILDFSYDNAWYPVTDGPGASLVIRNASADWRTWDLAESWRPSAYDFGSPAATDPPTNSWLPILVHEVLSHSDPPAVDAIELFNPNATLVDIGGWFLSDDLATPKKFRVPDATTVPPGGFVAFTEAEFNPTPGVPPSFAISSLGDEVFVFSGNGTNITGWLDGQSFGATEQGVSLGRYTNSQGALHFVAMSATNFGSHNALPKVGPVVVSEIMYHPPDDTSGDNSFDEFIELANISGVPVPLFDSANPSNTWRLRSGVDFDFPTNVTLAAGGFAVVVSFNPTNVAAADAFRARYEVSTNVSLYGPWSGKLDNSGESVALYKPDAPEAGHVPYILVERVDYSHLSPWPVVADAFGASLHRRAMDAYGNDATNWAGAPAGVGSAFTGGGQPVITAHPVSTTVLAGSTVIFSVSVTGSTTYAYQWQRNSNNIPGANLSTLTFTNVQPADSGNYRVIVLGAGGSAESDAATLTVLLPPTISAQPANVFLRVPPDPLTVSNRTAIFTVTATPSAGQLSYRWRWNGTNISLDATNMSGMTTNRLVVTNVLFEHTGYYSCAVSDANGTIYTTDAVLGVTPFLMGGYHPVTVTEGADISVSAIVQAWPPPFLYSWRRSTPVNTNIVSASGTNFATWNSTAAGYVLTNNIQSSNINLRLVFTNLATPANGIALTNSTVTIVADDDLDGVPNSLETALGLDPMLASDGDGDLDGDGMSNADEYRAGTELNNPASYLRVDQATVSGSALIHFAAVSNRTYTIQYTGALLGVSWDKLGDFVARGTNRVEILPDPDWSTNRYYRVVTPRQP